MLGLAARIADEFAGSGTYTAMTEGALPYDDANEVFGRWRSSESFAAMTCIQEHPDHVEQFRPSGPDDVAVEGPWFIIEPAQIRRLADIADDHDGAIKVESTAEPAIGRSSASTPTASRSMTDRRSTPKRRSRRRRHPRPGAARQTGTLAGGPLASSPLSFRSCQPA